MTSAEPVEVMAMKSCISSAKAPPEPSVLEMTMAGTSPSPASPAVIKKVGSAAASARPARPKVVA